MTACPVCGADGRPVLADWFSGAGGAGRGYQLAGFHTVGFDVRPQPRYPGCFVQADVMTAPLEGYDAYHASPPCQDYSKSMRHLATGRRGKLIDAVRDRLDATGRAWVIENVPGAPLPVQSDLFGRHGIELCGSMFGLELFGLRIYRHRLFEASFPLTVPRGCDHSRPAFNPHWGEGRERIFAANGRDDPERPWRQCMGVEWMHHLEARQAIPPAYTEYVGAALRARLEVPA